MPWGLVITDVFNLDVHKVHQQLVEDLVLGDGASEYGTVIHALDRSSQNLYLAARLARKAKLEEVSYSTELDKEMSVLRSAAKEALDEDRREGRISKAPTIQDIQDRVYAAWPDQVASITKRKEEMHGAMRAIEALEVAWRERCQALRVLAMAFRNAGA